MAQIVNRHTPLGQRALLHTLWLTFLCLALTLTVVSLGRCVVKDLGGVNRVRKVGLTKAFTERNFVSLAGKVVPRKDNDLLRRLGVPALHLLGIAVLGQLLWAPLSVIRRHSSRQQVLRELQQLPDDYWVLNDVPVPGPKESVQLDHVVASPYGLWCIETKEQRGRVTGGEMDFEWMQFGPRDTQGRYRLPFFNPIRQNQTHCTHLSDYLMLHGLQAPVRSMIVFPAAQLEVMARTPVEKPADVTRVILDRDEERVFTREQLETIVSNLSRLLTARPAISAA